MIDWRGMLTELLDNDHDIMTAWEVEFIENQARKADLPGRNPSEKEIAKIEEIWQRVFEGGPDVDSMDTDTDDDWSK